MYTYTPEGVCSHEILFDIEDGRLHNVHFEGGCNGNGKGIGALAEGRDVDSVIGLLKDIRCGGQDTSCPAQLAKALIEVKAGKGSQKEE